MSFPLEHGFASVGVILTATTVAATLAQRWERRRRALYARQRTVLLPAIRERLREQSDMDIESTLRVVYGAPITAAVGRYLLADPCSLTHVDARFAARSFFQFPAGGAGPSWQWGFRSVRARRAWSGFYCAGYVVCIALALFPFAVGLAHPETLSPARVLGGLASSAVLAALAVCSARELRRLRRAHDVLAPPPGATEPDIRRGAGPWVKSARGDAAGQVGAPPRAQSRGVQHSRRRHR
jgi:hypothetical protein